MIDLFILISVMIFIYVNIILGDKLKLHVLGIVAGFILLLTGFWLFNGVCYYSGTEVTSISPYNMTVEGNTTSYTLQTFTETGYCEEITTDYFNFFTVLQYFCWLGGLYVIFEFIFKLYNSK